MRPRSKGSLAFEEYWKSLRKEGAPVPSRGDFQPAKAARFLHNIVLLEAPGDGQKSLKMRVVGHVYQSAVQYAVAGTDHLNILPPQFHEGALASVRLMVKQPCGLWQVMPVYLNGVSRCIEFTAFPLAPGDDGIPLILGYLFPLEGLGLAPAALKQEVTVDTAVEFQFIDIGAGQPKWPLEAA
jgi:hypothetical protein